MSAFGWVSDRSRKVKAGFRRPVSNDGEGIYRSAEIGKISILGTRLSGSCWTSCSGHEWDAL